MIAAVAEVGLLAPVPIAILPMLVVNAIWGAFAGVVARALIDRRGLT